ncbi:hypothetical protein MAPG_02053 [Magnaporthiopsis poae ATCC 64411]|uniref:Uncharacterized protein n=1 Tax=Magnaporthiopsis poae (strain ATCC 64411 / 73-15) TaxID=644358 RepID=A0A0C4DQB5_MAGP6|nr:hypothetical protein MAPG_02053 [Magnaporthiopsis poae ATCC 64411]
MDLPKDQKETLFPAGECAGDALIVRGDLGKKERPFSLQSFGPCSTPAAFSQRWSQAQKETASARFVVVFLGTNTTERAGLVGTVAAKHSNYLAQIIQLSDHARKY